MGDFEFCVPFTTVQTVKSYISALELNRKF